MSTTVVHCFVDPACGWSAVASDWLRRVTDRSGVEVVWRPFSLWLRDGPADSVEGQVRFAALRALRVMAALQQAQPGSVDGYYCAVAAQAVPPTPFRDLEGALASCGGDPALAAAADDDVLDDVLRATIAEAGELVGGRPTIPVLAIDGRGFTGPLLDAPPADDDVLPLWDAVTAASRVPGFFELSRHRPPAPRHIRELLARFEGGGTA